MMRRKLFVVLMGLLLLDRPDPAIAGEPGTALTPAGKKAPASQFLRVRHDRRGEPVALETAVVRYRPALREGDIHVDLVSVVHLGERHYYQRLNDLFEGYDAVLYELVAEKGKRIPKGGRRSTDNPIALVQKIATTVLDLELQTNIVDYTAKNLIHADLSPAAMAEAARKRGDDALTIALSVAADLLRQQNLRAQKIKDQQPERRPAKSLSAEAGELLTLLTDSAAPSKLKRLMAEQLAAMSSPEGSVGKTLNTILITDRNQAAMKVLHRQLAAGKKKIAIFYGAGHMPDFEARLRAELDLRPVSTQWHEAWDLRLRERGLEEVLLRALLEQLMRRE